MKRNNRKSRKWTAVILIVVMTVIPVYFVSASNTSSKEELDRKIEQAESDLKQGKEQQNQLVSQIQEASSRIEELQNEIMEKDYQISEKQKEIDKTESELEQKKLEIGQQNQSMNIRLRIMYKRGDIGMLEVLTGATDISELISNIEMVQKIYESDISLLKELKSQYELIAEQIKDLKKLREQLEAEKAGKKENEEKLAGRMTELEQLEHQVEKDNEALEAQLDALNRESERITEEIRRQQLAASTSSDSEYSGGAMLWPVPDYSRISSKYGYRFHPILHVNKMHTGLDISAASGAEILASSDGTVILSSVKGGYGNCVMIDHGGGIVTLYGHCSKLLVSAGQHVARGQNVALVGSTGLSTGPHCHFEVRVNGSTTDPLNYLDLAGIRIS